MLYNLRIKWNIWNSEPPRKNKEAAKMWSKKSSCTNFEKPKMTIRSPTLGQKLNSSDYELIKFFSQIDFWVGERRSKLVWHDIDEKYRDGGGFKRKKKWQRKRSRALVKVYIHLRSSENSPLHKSSIQPT